MNEVKYHIVLDLTPELIRDLKIHAIQCNMKVKELVKAAILRVLATKEV